MELMVIHLVAPTSSLMTFKHDSRLSLTLRLHSGDYLAAYVTLGSKLKPQVPFPCERDLPGQYDRLTNGQLLMLLRCL